MQTAASLHLQIWTAGWKHMSVYHWQLCPAHQHRFVYPNAENPWKTHFLADLSLASSSLIALPSNYTAGRPSTLLLNLTDSFGNMIIDRSRVSELLNATSLQLQLKPLNQPQRVQLPWVLDHTGSQGVAINFTSTETGALSISLVLGNYQLEDSRTGMTSSAWHRLNASDQILARACVPQHLRGQQQFFWDASQSTQEPRIIRGLRLHNGELIDASSQRTSITAYPGIKFCRESQRRSCLYD